MTLIECFTAAHIDNFAACLSLRPQKMVLMGKQSDISQHINRYREILEDRHQRTTITPCPVDETDLHAICQALLTQISLEKECVIDITGGNELTIMAVGAVMASLSKEDRRKVRVQKMDREDGIICDCIHPGQTMPCKSAELTIRELIRLNGGKLLPSDYQPPRTARLSELDGIWEIITEDPAKWNKTITYLMEFEKRDNFKTNIRLNLKKLHSQINKFEEKYTAVRELLDKLDGPVIRDRSTDEVLDYSYNSPLMRYCTLKAGNTLEVKTLLTARTVLENGAPYFRDSMMSVNIDWDGVTHFPNGSVAETRNEIDVMLMKGTTPLFISCKNGDIGETELYKLNTVANHFGGAQAKKLLIATCVDEEDKTNRAIIRRAWDMDILLIPNAAKMTKAEWRKIIKDAMN